MKSTVTNSRARTNRKFSLLGACGLLAITVTQLPNLADLWKQLRSEQAHRTEMVAGISAPQRSAKLEEQLGEVQSRLAAFDAAMVDISMMPTIQSELMELARLSGCQLRKAVILAGASESWEPEVTEDVPSEESGYARQSPYTLTTEQLSLSLTGTLDQSFDFLQRLRRRPWLMRVAQINFSRDPEGGGQLFFEASLAFYKLIKKESEETELVQWRDGARATAVH